MTKEYTQVETDADDQYRLYELLHGASLASRHLDAVLNSGRPLEVDGVPRSDLFTKYPRLGAAAEAAEGALFDLYQEIGRHWMPEKMTGSLEELATAKAALQLVYDGGGYLEDGPEVAKAVRDALFGVAGDEVIGDTAPGSHGEVTP